MKANTICLMVVGLIGAVLVAACGPSQADLDATATRAAADMSATQTAQAPTAPPTFTPTPTPTPTPPSPRTLLESSFAALREANIVTSNLDVDEWGAAFPNKLLGAATIDRLRDGAYRVILDGESHRRPRPLPELPSTPSASARKSRT